MKKRPFGLRLLCVLGFLSGGWVVLIFMEPNTGHAPAYLGMIYIAVNVGLWFFHNWARVTMLALSWLFIAVFVLALPSAGQSAIGLLLMSPLIIYNVACLSYLYRPRIKELFIQK